VTVMLHGHAPWTRLGAPWRLWLPTEICDFEILIFRLPYKEGTSEGSEAVLEFGMRCVRGVPLSGGRLICRGLDAPESKRRPSREQRQGLPRKGSPKVGPLSRPQRATRINT
jgi:hypothetical protein